MYFLYYVFNIIHAKFNTVIGDYIIIYINIDINKNLT